MKRMGTNKRSYFRIVVTDSRCARNGKFIEQVGIYHPIAKESEQLKFDADKIKKWFLNGAKPSNVVKKLLNKKNFRFDKELLQKG